MDLKEAEAQGLKQFKVAVIQARADLYTIWAKDGEDAVKLVQGGEGRPAGVQGPSVVSTLAREMPDGGVDYIALLFAILSRQQLPVIERPRMVVGMK